jgi:transcriptional regulator with XRE-family HTH domain
MKDEVVKANIAANIARIRKELGYSQYRLAQLAGTDEMHIRRVEAAKFMPRAGTLVRFAAALGVPCNVLIEYPPTQRRPKPKPQEIVVSNLSATS